MEISIFFARFLGSFFLIFGLLFIVTKQLGKTIEMTDDKAFVISTGYITLLLGLVTVVLHNLWVADWRVVITILGWAWLIKGILKIGFPEFINKHAQKFAKREAVSAVFLMFLSAWLLWMSFK
jgi:hypothetical protein